MSVQDEDDDFFADVYGENNSNKSTSGTGNNGDSGSASTAAGAPAVQPAESQHGSVDAKRSDVAPPPPQQATSAPGSTAQTGDPRFALFGDSTNRSSESSGAAGAASAQPSDSNANTSSAGSAGFDAAAFSRQLQQLQQLQQMSSSSGSGAAASVPQQQPQPQDASFGMPQAAQMQAAAQAAAGMRQTGHTDEGYHAGNIFIPAKDEGKMFIGGLNWETTDESMKNYFSQFGEVLECNVMRDPNTGRSRGFGFLTFKDSQSVTEVLKREHFLDGKIIDPKRAIPREEQDKTAKIFVGGVGMDVTEQDFKNFFEQYGTVIDAQLMIDKDTGRPRGFGFVTFDDHKAVDTIVAEKFLDLKGKSIEVKRAEPRMGRDWHNRNGAAGFQNRGNMGGMNPQGMYPNAMDPTMMAQYYQQWQAYMAQMQDAMKGGQAGMPGMQGMSGMPMMPGMAGGFQGMQQPPAQMPQQPADPRRAATESGDDDRDFRRDRRRGDERRRSRSPPGNRRRRGGGSYRDPRDRNFNR